MNVEKVAVVGATGYSGEELVRLLSRHPEAELVCLTSRQNGGQSLETIYSRFRNQKFGALKFVSSEASAVIASGAQSVFLALPHGVAAEFAGPLLEAGLRVIDLSADFRLKDAAVYAEYYDHAHPAPELLQQAVYALSELNTDPIRGAKLIACPGCYPASGLVPLVPLLRAGLINDAPIAVSSMSGVSGAGRKENVSFLFCEC